MVDIGKKEVQKKVLGATKESLKTMSSTDEKLYAIQGFDLDGKVGVLTIRDRNGDIIPTACTDIRSLVTYDIIARKLIEDGQCSLVKILVYTEAVEVARYKKGSDPLTIEIIKYEPKHDD